MSTGTNPLASILGMGSESGGSLIHGGPNTATPPSIGANLLRWTEQFQQSGVWIVSGSLTVTANTGTDLLGGTTADRLDFLDVDSCSIIQTSATAGTIVTTSTNTVTTTTPTRYSVAKGGFVFSVWLHSIGGDAIHLSIGSAGGFIQCGLFDVSGGGPSIFAWGAKLETGNTPTGDETNYGRVN